MGTEKTAKIGMALFLTTEAMFFAGLLSAYWVLRAQMPTWPPPGQPRLPILVTGINTGILVLGGLAIARTLQAVRKGCRLCVIGLMGIAALTGGFFLSLQGYEWIRLIGFGLKTGRNIYGGLFYILVGTHGIHALAGLIFLVAILWRVALGHSLEGKQTGITLCRIYWIFVVALWPVIYVALYLL